MATKSQTVYLGAGCFWNTELIYSKVQGVESTEVGWGTYATESGMGRTEVVKVLYNPDETSLAQLVNAGFWDAHDATNEKHRDLNYVERSMLLADDINQADQLDTILAERKRNQPTILTQVAILTKYERAPEKDQKYYQKDS